MVVVDDLGGAGFVVGDPHQFATEHAEHGLVEAAVPGA
jgi:hypothetical protein